MATNGNTPALLALPVELLGRIVDSLGPESLLMLRLTCKVLEHSTYNLVAKTFFEQRFCCIYYEPRWLLLNNVTSSSLGSRVREVTFTTEPLESKQYKDLQLAQQERETDLSEAQNIAGCTLTSSIGLEPQIPSWPSTAMFHRVFRDLKRLAPRTLIRFDFLKGWLPKTNSATARVKTNIFVAAVTAGVAIDTLKLGVHDTHLLRSVLLHLASQLMASSRSLKHFELQACRIQKNEYDAQFLTTILRTAEGVRKLIVNSLPVQSMTTTILRVNNFSQLTTLRVTDASFSNESFVTGLSDCRSMLHLHLSLVEIDSGEEPWPGIFSTLASMSQLHHLCLHLLCNDAFKYSWLAFHDLVQGTTTHEGSMVEYQGREQVAAGLDELMAAPSLMSDGWWFVLPSMAGECRICGDDTE